ncbi:MAG: OmpA family protein, partial [Pseudomonadota bacterium]
LNCSKSNSWVLYQKWGDIEQDIATRSQSALNNSGLSWAASDTYWNGRDVTITGIAPNQIAIEQALKETESTYGVRVANFKGSIAELEAEQSTENTGPKRDASISARLDGEVLVLSGVVGEQAHLDKIIAAAGQSYGQGQVRNQISVDLNTTDLPDLGGVFNRLAATDFSAEGSQIGNGFNLVGSTLVLKGIVATTPQRDELESFMQGAFAGDVINQVAALDVKTDSRPVSVIQLITDDKCTSMVNEILATAKINFELGQAIVKAESNSLLSTITTATKRCPDAQFEVAGHTDNTGDLDFNMILSEQRAQAVVDRLSALGVSPDRLSVVGYGPTQPVADNSTPEGQAANRRIEFKLSTNSAQTQD